jgi:hypothetical protein
MFERLRRLLLDCERSNLSQLEICEKLERHINTRAQEPRQSRHQTQVGLAPVRGSES